eukprot:TRINITY_DN7064_c0_g1_i2.p1 TRINITY_DN7064_c0_g1~~TRINITY_DN7064_c0_g1_i2.p1  ORF type:complete len:252 (+),score=45.34 TRINITY_DN7064_c0_g1_i2:388-1143(+)
MLRSTRSLDPLDRNMSLEEAPARTSPSCRGQIQKWGGDKTKLDEILNFHNKQRSSQDMLAEFRDLKRQHRRQRQNGECPPSGERAPPAVMEEEGVLLKIARSPDGARAEQFRAGRWANESQLDEVLAFHGKQRPSTELVEEFRRNSKSSSVRSTPSSLQRSKVGSPLSLTWEGATPSPTLVALEPRAELRGVEVLHRGTDPLSVWEGDERKLDEVLAFQEKHRSSEQVLAEFQEQQRARKDRAARRSKPGR